MEICDERIHAAKFTRRMDEYRRFSHVRARSLQWLLMRREEIFDVRTVVVPTAIRRPVRGGKSARWVSPGI